MIRAENVSRAYDGRTVVSNVSLHVAAGECVVLTGEQTGRRTLIRMLATLVQPSAGEVQIAGIPVSSRWLDARRRLAFADSACLIDGLSVAEYFRLVTRTRGKAPDVAAEQVSAVLGEAAIGSSTPIERLTSGQRRVLASAAALSVDADALILDDPFAEVNGGARAALLASLEDARRRGKGIVIRSDTTSTGVLTARRMTVGPGRVR